MSNKILSQAENNNNRQPIYSGTKIIGIVRGKIFYKSVQGSKHFLRQPPAIATDNDALEQAEKAGAKWMVVTDKETGTIYRTELNLFHKAGFSIERRFGQQTGLPMGYWSRSSKRDTDTQLPLFGNWKDK